METILLLGALGYGLNAYMNKDVDVAEAPSDTHWNTEVSQPVINKGLADLDWSKAGNFVATSSDNNVTWVFVTANVD